MDSTECPGVKIELERIVIIGTGPTALGAAHRLYELGIMRSDTQVILLEESSKPGGLATSERDEKGFLWDMGGHVVFSHYNYFTKVLDKAIPEWNKHVRAAYAFMKGSDGNRKFIPYPVQDNIHVMDAIDRDKSLSGLEMLSLDPSHKIPTNFDEWLLMNFGVGLCEVFMRKYNRKVWTVNTTEMNAVWVGERVAVPDVNKIKAKIAASGREQEAKDSAWGPNQFFRFPRYGGTGAIWRGVAEELPRGLFHFKHKVVGVNVREKVLKVASQGNGKMQSLKYDYLISTTPLDLFLGNMVKDSDPTSEKMKSLAKEFVSTHTHVTGIGMKGQPPLQLQNKSWMYFPDSDAPFYRITVFSSYSDDHVPEAGNYWSLMCESAEPMASHSWTKETLLNETVAALVSYGFITLDQVVSRYYHRLDHGYPVPSLGREKLLTTIQPWLLSNGIYARGRFGGWRYEVGNQDHSFMQGVEVADLLMRKIAEETYPDPGRVNAMKGTDRTLPCSPPAVAPDTEYVVAHYNENLDWLTPVENRCHIYTKGPDSTHQFKFRQWERLPNVGREGHTYLHHIITNYDRLSDITVFTQGSISGHQACYTNISKYISQAQENQFSCKLMGNFSGWGRIKHFGTWKRDFDTGKMRHANQTMGEFWQSIFGFPHPKSVEVCWCGCFSATRKQLQKHPIKLYKSMFTYLEDHPNPEEGHYVERLWRSIISHK